MISTPDAKNILFFFGAAQRRAFFFPRRSGALSFSLLTPKSPQISHHSQ
jgi:hypothetical protein